MTHPANLPRRTLPNPRLFLLLQLCNKNDTTDISIFEVKHDRKMTISVILGSQWGMSTMSSPYNPSLPLHAPVADTAAGNALSDESTTIRTGNANVLRLLQEMRVYVLSVLFNRLSILFNMSNRHENRYLTIFITAV